MATFTKAEKPQNATLVQPRDRTRGPDQTALDALVKTELVEPWEKAGKPLPIEDPETHALSPNPASPDLPLKVKKAEKTEFKSMVRRALSLHKLVPIWYTDGAEDSDGMVVVTFQAGPRPEPKPKAEADGQTAQASTEGTQEGTQDQGDGQPQAEEGKARRFGR
jgi:hypothetical protein